MQSMFVKFNDVVHDPFFLHLFPLQFSDCGTNGFFLNGKLAVTNWYLNFRATTIFPFPSFSRILIQLTSITHLQLGISGDDFLSSTSFVSSFTVCFTQGRFIELVKVMTRTGNHTLIRTCTFHGHLLAS